MLDIKFTLCELNGMGHDAFIEKLGDTGAVASITGQKDSTVSNWKARSIPWRFRPQLAEIAKQRGVDVPEGFLGMAA